MNHYVKGLSCILYLGKVRADQPELSLDDPDLTTSEKLSRVRVGTLVKEYLAAQELELLGENAMSDAVHKFVDKDDPQSIQMSVGAIVCPFMTLLGTNHFDVGTSTMR